MHTNAELIEMDRAAERRLAAEDFRARHPEYFNPCATALHPLFDGILNAAAATQRVVAAAVLSAAECAAMDDTAGLITNEPFDITPSQRGARAEFEDAYRAGELRGLPTAFGALS